MDRTVLAPALAAALALALPACGKRGDPLPPLRRTPQPVPGLRVSQRGDRLEIACVAPRASVDGVALASLEVEILRADVPGDLEKVGTRERRKAAPGTPVVVDLPLPGPGTTVRVAARAIASGRPSVTTPPQLLVVQPPISPPHAFVARLGAEGVVLAWEGERPKPVPKPTPSPPPFGTSGPSPSPSVATPSPPATTPSPAPSATPVPLPVLSPGASPAPVASPSPSPSPTPPPFRGGFWVYRRAEEGRYGPPLFPQPTEEQSWTDTTARPGESWCYVVRAVASTDPVIESASSEDACLEVHDITPPAVPFGLTVLAREGGLEVSWSPSAEPDLARYRLYRGPAGAPREPLAEIPVGQTLFLDRSAESGVAYLYALSAVDNAGNESPQTHPVEATLR